MMNYEWKQEIETRHGASVVGAGFASDISRTALIVNRTRPASPITQILITWRM